MEISYKLIIDTLFPPRCSVCLKYTNHYDTFESLCNKCLNSVAIKTGFSCPECGKRIPTITSMCHRTNFLLVAPSAYSNTYIETLIQDLKFKYIKSAALPLAHMILQSLSSILEEIPFDISRALLVPIPLAPRRERERGFNQSALIAKEINMLVPQLTYAPEILMRVRYELPQSKTRTQKEREAHLKNAFLARIPPKMAGLPLFLVDDVYTTGATIRNAIIELKNKGAGKIIVLVAAKT
jgi:ComF family protein